MCIEFCFSIQVQEKSQSDIITIFNKSHVDNVSTSFRLFSHDKSSGTTNYYK